MVSRLHHFPSLIAALFAQYAIDQSMLRSDAPGPPSRQILAQRLRLSQAGKRMAADVFQQIIQTPMDRRIGLRPVQVNFPGLGGEM